MTYCVKVLYEPDAHGGVILAYGNVSKHVALVDNDTSVNLVYGNQVCMCVCVFVCMCVCVYV